MRYLHAFLLLIAVLFVLPSDALANRSTFKVEDAKPLANGDYQITLATNHFTRPMAANFYAHTATPLGNSRANVEAGMALGTLQLAVGPGTHTLTVPKATVDKLGLKEGQSLHLAAVWPDLGHTWGTPSKNAGTNFKLAAPTAKAEAEAKETVYQGKIPFEHSEPLWKGASEAKDGKPAAEGQAIRAELAKAADIASLPHGARGFASAGSLIETEGKVGIAKKKHLRQTIGLLKKMSGNKALAEKVLGPGWSIKYLAAYTFNDTYKDNAAHDLAKSEAGLRVRRVPGSGQPGQINFKDPNGKRAGPNGIMMERVERAVTVGPNPDMKAVANSTDKYSPVAGLKNAESYMNDSSAQIAKRTRFQLMYADPAKAGAPQAVAEISADHVFDFRSKQGAAKHERVAFFGLEVDIAHQPVNGAGGAGGDFIKGPATWTGPHKGSDLAYLAGDATVQNTYKVIGKMMDHLVDHGVKLRPTVPKYTEGKLRSGVITASNAGQRNAVSRSKTSFLKAANPVKNVGSEKRIAKQERRKVEAAKAKAAKPARARR